VAAAAASPGGLTVADRRALIARLTPGDLSASLSKTLRHSGPDAFDASLLKYMERRAGPKFFFNSHQLARSIQYATDHHVDGISRALTHADALLAHRFPEQVNSDDYAVQLPADIDWDAQPASTDNADFLHALNRQQFWKELGNAYRLTGDGKYVRELVSELTSWSAQTPALKNPEDWEASSPHWWLLDASDRVNNWTYAYFMVLGSSDWTPAANTLFLSKLWEHGDFLARVTPASYRQNRTAIHAGGLLRVGLMFPEFADAAAWEYRGADMTFRCLAAQFYPDGGHVEETPAYQASAANAFLENFQLAKLNGLTYWTKNRTRLFDNTVSALAIMTNARGGLAGLSDTYRASTASSFLNRAYYVVNPASNPVALLYLDDVLLIGADRILPPGSTEPPVTADPPATSALPDTGYYVLRGTDAGARAIIDAGPKGGNHGHFDLLSFEFDEGTYSEPPVPDPGPYRYDDSPERQYVVSTPAHNTISIDGLNHEAVEGMHNPKVVVDALTSGANEARFTAHHHAYEYLAGRPTVGRTLWVDRTPDTLPLAIVVDWARAAASHKFTTTFNLGTATAVQSAPGVIDASLTRTFRLRVQSLSARPQAYDLTDSFISSAPPPDERTPNKTYTASQTGTSALFVTLISEYVPGGTRPTAPASIAFDGPPRKGQPVHLRLTMPDGTVRLLDFPPPDLDPLPTAITASAAPHRPTPFSTTSIHAN
jgi:hypothetical protein